MDMSPNGVHQIEIFSSLLAFAKLKFDIKISQNGKVLIDGEPCSVSYKRDQWTEEEILKDVVKTRWFKGFLQRKYYRAFKIQPL